jgi:transcriptional regulator with XRE-family HTH domain
MNTIEDKTKLIENAVEDFGNTIRNFRIKNGLTLQDMAEVCDCSPSYIWRVEQHRRNPGIDVRIKILEKGLGFTAEDIYEYLKKYLQQNDEVIG